MMSGVQFLSPQPGYRMAAQFSTSSLCCLCLFVTWATLDLIWVSAVVYMVVKLSKSLPCSWGCVLHMWNLGMCPVSIPVSPLQDFLYTLWLPETPFSVLLAWKMGSFQIFALYTAGSVCMTEPVLQLKWQKKREEKNNWDTAINFCITGTFFQIPLCRKMDFLSWF